MKEFRTGRDIASEILMLQSAHKGSVLLVEGDSDRRVYASFKHDECDIIVCDGKNNVLSAIESINSMKLKAVLGIVDADYDRINLTKLKKIKNILLTDTHDTETMIIKSHALDKILTEYASHHKLHRFQLLWGKNPRDIIIYNCSILGYARWFALLHKLYWRFKGVDFLDFTSTDSLKVNIPLLIAAVAQKEPKERRSKKKKRQQQNRKGKKIPLKEADLDQLVSELQQLIQTQVDPWQVSRGHDLVIMLYIGLKYVFGSDEETQKLDGPKELEKILRLAFDKHDFTKTNLYKDIKKWEKKQKQPVLAI